MTLCPSCGASNREGRKFCAECGSAFSAACQACGAANQPGERFCGECGAALSPGAMAGVAPAAAVHEAPSAERRLVSVLFADLVGHTSFSEGRDAEDVRELLTRYFDTARTTIERYGGTVEKFIGDAVMAVWGTPVAQEDDAERAVRAALELVEAIPVVDPGLLLRAGVVTGQAAVTVGAEGQGMVAGDLVNTASRVEGVAEPGTVLVGEATRRATEAAIVYEDAGAHELKGKAEPLPLWTALRVVANRGGEGRSAGLEAPFVGRDREFRLVKDLFQGTAAEGKAHVVLVTGIAGIGKSRLAWEFEKYVSGLVASVWWHRGRCPAYGEGVAYWALAEMVRGRAGILENEDSESATAKLGAVLEQHIPDADDRRWIEPRLRHLLALDESASHERDDLFAAWRFFFESLAGTGPTVLVFEDLQWADAGLLDFVEYLLEWARSKPIFIIGLARPELTEKRAGFGSASRGLSGLALEPLSPEAMGTLLEGLVPGLPDELRAAISERAEGVPLYAVETVRMLLDRGQVERADGSYRLVGTVERLAVPETLHALVASRLDELTDDERRLVRDASVLGTTFVLAALEAVTGTSSQELEPVLQSLVRKEMLCLDADRRSPERGQYGFLQDLVRHVAYETLSRRDRKARHLAAAAFFERSWGGREQEVVEVVAAHYLTALELDPNADDASALRDEARNALARAGERAASLGASGEAATCFARAAGLAEDPLEKARLLHLAGRVTRFSGDPTTATEQLQQAIALYEHAGQSHAAARVSADLGQLEFFQGRLHEGVERLERAFDVLSQDEPDEDIAYLASQLGRFHYFEGAGSTEKAAERNEFALSVSEALLLPEVLAHALITAGLIAWRRGQPEHGRALMRHGLQLALEHDFPLAAGRGCQNLSVIEGDLGNLADAVAYAEQGAEVGRRIGDRQGQAFSRTNIAWHHFELGNWEEIHTFVDELFAEPETWATSLTQAMPRVAWHRGQAARVRRLLDLADPLRDSDLPQNQATYTTIEYIWLMNEGRYEEAFLLSERDAARTDFSEYAAWIVIDALEAATALDRLDRIAELVRQLESQKPGELPLVARVEAMHYRALLAAASGDAGRADSGYRTAASMFREYGYVFRQAVTQLEHAEWLAKEGREPEAAPLLEEAREIFERLEATPWLERTEKVSGSTRVPA